MAITPPGAPARPADFAGQIREAQRQLAGASPGRACSGILTETRLRPWRQSSARFRSSSSGWRRPANRSRTTISAGLSRQGGQYRLGAELADHSDSCRLAVRNCVRRGWVGLRLAWRGAAAGRGQSRGGTVPGSVGWGTVGMDPGLGAAAADEIAAGPVSVPVAPIPALKLCRAGPRWICPCPMSWATWRCSECVARRSIVDRHQ